MRNVSPESGDDSYDMCHVREDDVWADSQGSTDDVQQLHMMFAVSIHKFYVKHADYTIPQNHEDYIKETYAASTEHRPTNCWRLRYPRVSFMTVLPDLTGTPELEENDLLFELTERGWRIWIWVKYRGWVRIQEGASLGDKTLVVTPGGDSVRPYWV